MTPKPSTSVSTADLEAAVASEAQQIGLSVEAAQAIAELSVCAICSVLGGSQVYFPQQLVKQYRDRLIYQWANGRNTKDLAVKFKLSPSRVEQIVSQARKAKGRV